MKQCENMPMCQCDDVTMSRWGNSTIRQFNNLPIYNSLITYVNNLVKLIAVVLFFLCSNSLNIFATIGTSSTLGLPTTFVIDSTACHYRVSIITCGIGEELYACYGHSAVRIIDSCKGTDIVYNYGTFDFGDPDFYSKFTRGKLPYYLAQEQFQNFMGVYVDEGRSVQEQVLNLSPLNAKKVQAFLLNNIKEENKYYHYDFLLDNCSTRIRDIFSKEFGERFVFGHSMANDSCSFRTILNYYERNKHWERFGINLLMSNVVDKKMSNLQSMFLPDYLLKGFADARLDDKPIVSETNTLLQARNAIPTELNQPKVVFWCLLLFIVLLSFSKKIKPFLLYFDVLLFLILGLLGCFMLFMWFGTEHTVCMYNRNLFWAFPLHIVFAFLLPRGTQRVAQYANYASWLIILSLIYNIVADQKYIAEITPLLILILFRLNQYSKQTRSFSFNR